jgi:hypothetical protein
MNYSKQQLASSPAHKKNKCESQVCLCVCVCVWSIRTSALASWISLYKMWLRCFHLRALALCLWYRYRWLCSRSWDRTLYDMTLKMRWYGEFLAAFTACAIIRAYWQYKFLYWQIKTHQTNNMRHIHVSKHLSNLWIMGCCGYEPYFYGYKLKLQNGQVREAKRTGTWSKRDRYVKQNGQVREAKRTGTWSKTDRYTKQNTRKDFKY